VDALANYEPHRKQFATVRRHRLSESAFGAGRKNRERRIKLATASWTIWQGSQGRIGTSRRQQSGVAI
jgi:hypothetical protein